MELAINILIGTFRMFQSPKMYEGYFGVLYGLFTLLLGALFAVLIAGSYTASSILCKKGRVFGFIAAATNGLAALATPIYVLMFHRIRLNGTVGAIIGDSLRVLSRSIIAVLFLVAFLASCTYLIIRVSTKPRAVAIIALVVNIARYLLIKPNRAVGVFFSKLIYTILIYSPVMESQITLFNERYYLFEIVQIVVPHIITANSAFGQGARYIIYFVSMLLPALIILLSTVISFIVKKRAEKKEVDKLLKELEKEAIDVKSVKNNKQTKNENAEASAELKDNQKPETKEKKPEVKSEEKKPEEKG